MSKIESVEELFNSEISKSERLRSLILIGLLGVEAIFLLIIYLFYSAEYLAMFKTHISIYAILIFTVIIIVFESLVHYLIGKESKIFLLNRRFFGYFNSFSEVSLLSILLIFIVEYSQQNIRKRTKQHCHSHTETETANSILKKVILLFILILSTNHPATPWRFMASFASPASWLFG